MVTSDLDLPDTPGPEQMKELIAGLSPAERAILKDPDFITADEVDIIMSDRSFHEDSPRITFDELLKETGLVRRRQRTA